MGAEPGEDVGRTALAGTAPRDLSGFVEPCPYPWTGHFEPLWSGTEHPRRHQCGRPCSIFGANGLGGLNKFSRFHVPIRMTMTHNPSAQALIDLAVHPRRRYWIAVRRKITRHSPTGCRRGSVLCVLLDRPVLLSDPLANERLDDIDSECLGPLENAPLSRLSRPLEQAARTQERRS
jgi:hypothetical protein